MKGNLILWLAAAGVLYWYLTQGKTKATAPSAVPRGLTPSYNPVNPNTDTNSTANTIAELAHKTSSAADFAAGLYETFRKTGTVNSNNNTTTPAPKSTPLFTR